MTRSTPFFNPKAPKRHWEPLDGLTDKQYRELHWTKQLELRPLRNKKRWEQPDLDHHYNRWDMDLDENITIEEITI